MERLTKRVGDGEATPICDFNICTPFEKSGLCKTGMQGGPFGRWERHCNDLCILGRMIDRLAHYEDLEEQGRLVVLPFAPGTTLVDRSEPERPELLKNFRLAVAYDHNGIVFHHPLGIFLEDVQRGYITQVSEEAERAMEGGSGNA